MSSRFGHTLTGSRLDFENRTQSEAREPPTSGYKSVMEGTIKVLRVSIALLYTYTNRNHQYTRKRVAVYLHVLMIHCRLEILRRRSEASELPTSGHRWGMESTIKVLIVSIGLSYTYPMRNHQYIRKRVMHAFTRWPYIGWMLVGFRDFSLI